MLSSASHARRRSLQALCRLACTGPDAGVSGSCGSSSAELPPGRSVCAPAAPEPLQHWYQAGAASIHALFRSWPAVHSHTAHDFSAAAQQQSALCGRGTVWLARSPPQPVMSPPSAAAGIARGAKTQAAQQRGGSKQQQLRQRRAPVDDYPPVEQKGVVSVMSTKNNTIITLADEAGNVKAW